MNECMYAGEMGAMAEQNDACTVEKSRNGDVMVVTGMIDGYNHQWNMPLPSGLG